MELHRIALAFGVAFAGWVSAVLPLSPEPQDDGDAPMREEITREEITLDPFRALHEQLLAALDGGDSDGVRKVVSGNGVLRLYVLDGRGASRTLSGAPEIFDWVRSWVDSAAETGDSRITRHDVVVDSGAYVVVAFDVERTSNGSPQKLHVTSVVMRGGGGGGMEEGVPTPLRIGHLHISSADSTEN